MVTSSNETNDWQKSGPTFPVDFFFLITRATMMINYLDNGDLQERPAEADGEGRGGHDDGAGDEADEHGVDGGGAAAREDPRLQRHEQSCTQGRV